MVHYGFQVFVCETGKYSKPLTRLFRGNRQMWADSSPSYPSFAIETTTMLQPEGASEVNAAQPYPLCWVGSFSKNFHSTTPATISIHFLPLVFCSFPPPVEAFNHDKKSESFWAQKLRRPVNRPKAPCSQNSNPGPLSFFFGPGPESFSKARGKFLNFTAHWSTFLAPWP